MVHCMSIHTLGGLVGGLVGGFVAGLIGMLLGVVLGGFLGGLLARLWSHFDVVHGVLLASLFVSIFLRVPLLSLPLLSVWHGGANVPLLPAVGAVLWFLLVHGALKRESLLLSRLASRSEQRARRTRMATKALVLFSAAVSPLKWLVLAPKGVPFVRWLDPQQQPKYEETALASSLVHVATITAGILFLPASMRSTAVLHGGPC